MFRTGRHKDMPPRQDIKPAHRPSLAAAAGISLTELLMPITLFSITVAGVIDAINTIDTVTTSYVSESAQREANHADFNNAYDRIS